jgi:hypothetical protein
VVAVLLFFLPSSAGTVAISLPLAGFFFLGVTDFLIFLLDLGTFSSVEDSSCASSSCDPMFELLLVASDGFFVRFGLKSSSSEDARSS